MKKIREGLARLEALVYAHRERHQLGGGDQLELDASQVVSGTFDIARMPDIPRSRITDFFSSPFWPNIPDKPSTFPPGLHASTHGLGGIDELSLDATQIASGVFDAARVPDLDASKITSGIFDLARIPNMDWSRISGNFPRAVGDLISSAFSRSWISDFFSSPFWPNIPDKPSTFPPGLHASAHGLGGADQISIDASQTASGVFSADRIPNLDASKITTGVFDLARIPRIDLARLPRGSLNYFIRGQGDAADAVWDTLKAADIPGLDASKIVSGTFDAARIPDLDASKITSGRFLLARLPTSTTADRFLAVRTAGADPVWDALLAADIPSLDASKITTGIFDIARIPNLDAGKITSGVFDQARIPWTSIPSTGIVIGGDTNLYRSAANVLKTDDNFDALALRIGGVEIVTSGRVLQNVTANTGIITSGRFPVSRLPDGPSGYVMVGQGSGYDLAWQTISGIAGTITDSQHGSKTGIPFAHHGDWGHYGKVPTTAPTGAAERAYVDSANLYVHDGSSWVLRATKDWNNLINKPSTYPPSSHTHPRSDVTDFWSTPFWSNIPDKPSTFPPSAHTHPRSDITDFFNSPFWTNIPDKPSTFPPSAHASSHEYGGADQVRNLDYLNIRGTTVITSGRALKNVSAPGDIISHSFSAESSTSMASYSTFTPVAHGLRLYYYTCSQYPERFYVRWGSATINLGCGLVVADGTNVNFYNYTGATATLYWRDMVV